MKSVRIRFDPAGWEIDIFPATQENEEYVELIKELAAPHQLALSIDRLTDARAADILARAYAETIIEGSPTPGLPESPDGWHAWLIEHPEEFETIVRTAMAPDLWEEMAGGGSDVQGV